MDAYIDNALSEFDLTKKISTLVICGHGGSDHLTLGKGEEGKLSLGNVKTLSLESLEERASIILISCEVGQKLPPAIHEIKPLARLFCSYDKVSNIIYYETPDGIPCVLFKERKRSTPKSK